MADFQQIVFSPNLYINNLELSVASNTTLSVAAGRCRDSLDNYDIISESTLTLNAAINGAGGLDTGTFAASTPYFVHIMGDQQNYNDPALIFSLSKTAPLIPQGYTCFRNIGWALTDGSTHFLPVDILGNGNVRTYQWETLKQVLSGGTSTSFAAVAMQTAMPKIALPVYLNANYTPNNAANTAQLRATGSTVAEDSVPIILSGAVASVAMKTPPFRMLCRLSSGNPSIDYIVQASDTLSLYVIGFDYYL